MWADVSQGKAVGIEFGSFCKELDAAKPIELTKEKEKTLSPGFSVTNLSCIKDLNFFEIYL